jgi:molybdate transport system substrate-binding protein
VRATLAVLLVAALVVPVAFARRDGERGRDSTLTVYAASSLTDAFPRISKAPRYSFGGSDELYAQLAAGAPADVFASASPKWTQLARSKSLVLQPVWFATNRLVLVVPRSNPAHLRSVFGLRRHGIKLVIGSSTVPIGSYTRKVLARLGLSAVLRNVVSEEPDVRSILAKVALGEADAGFVYVTDARTVRAKTRTIAIPARGQPSVRYELAVVKSSGNRAAARAFVHRVLSAAGRRVLLGAGFGVPPKKR